jgi:hypothetical protein
MWYACEKAGSEAQAARTYARIEGGVDV